MSDGSTRLEKLEQDAASHRQQIAELSEELAARLDPAEMPAHIVQGIVRRSAKSAGEALDSVAKDAPLVLLGLGAGTALISSLGSRDTAGRNGHGAAVDQPTARRSLPRSRPASPAQERWLVPAGLFAAASLTLAAWAGRRERRGR